MSFFPPRLRRDNCHKLPLFCAKLTLFALIPQCQLNNVNHIVQLGHIVQIGSHCAKWSTVTTVPRESHCAKGHWYMVTLCNGFTVTTDPLIPADCDKCASVAKNSGFPSQGAGEGRGERCNGSKVPQEIFLFFETEHQLHIVNIDTHCPL